MSQQNEIFSKVTNQLSQEGFQVVSSDFERPWGGFFVIDETQIKKFA